jgi:NitT/TauT family transport system substrate-binding protein
MHLSEKLMDSTPRDEHLGSLKAAFETTGSPRWIMHTIKKQGLDSKHNFHLEVDYIDDRVKNGLQSSEAALAGGKVDFIDTDWLSIARCRTQGMEIGAVFPYGRIMGGMVVPGDSAIQSLEDLRGKRIGVVRLHDKNWTIARAVCVRRYAFDPFAVAEVTEAGSKTVLIRQLEEGRVDCAFVFWHLIPRLTLKNQYRQVCDILDLLPDLGIDRCPTTFFTFRDAFIEQHSCLIRAFVAAYSEAVELMRNGNGVWEEVNMALLHGCDPELLRAIREKWESRVTTAWDESMVGDLHRLFDEIQRFGGPTAVGCDRIPAGTFTTAFMQ